MGTGPIILTSILKETDYYCAIENEIPLPNVENSKHLPTWYS